MAQPVPSNPRIYHITHASNLPSIVGHGCLWWDSQRIRRGLQTSNIGYSHIKQRRLGRSVPTAAGGTLGDYVPFNFCNRSVMLYVVHKGHTDYCNGQSEVVHLVSSVATAVGTGRPWAFTDRHAELGFAMYHDDLSRLDEVDWSVMPLVYWGGNEDTRQKRGAEFLVHQSFPWTAIEEIGVHNDGVAARVRAALGSHGPPVQVRPAWYY